VNRTAFAASLTCLPKTDLTVATQGTVQPLQVTIDDECQVVELLTGRQSQTRQWATTTALRNSAS
jgi:hypothetical protein